MMLPERIDEHDTIEVRTVAIAPAAVSRVPRSLALDAHVLPIAIEFVDDVDERLVLASPLAARYERAVEAMRLRRQAALAAFSEALERRRRRDHEQERARAAGLEVHSAPEEPKAARGVGPAATDLEAEKVILRLRRVARVDDLRFVPSAMSVVQSRTLQCYGPEAPQDPDANVAYVDKLLTECVYGRFTDLEIAPTPTGGIAAGRVDGSWVQFDPLTSVDMYDRVINVVKTRAAGPHLQAGTEHIPQDGQLTIAAPHRRVDVRVNVLPIRRKDSVWLRFHDLDISIASPERIGMPDYVLQLFDDAMLQTAAADVVEERLFSPNGIIAIVGQQGTGKTTTFESYMLHRLVPRGWRCAEVGNPIEREIHAFAQFEINDRSSMTWDDVSRALKRRKYDFTALVEARDADGIRAMFSAGSTGGLTGVTVHASNAITLIEKMQEFNVPISRLETYLKLVLSQRLVRRLCSDCCEPELAPARLVAYRPSAEGEVIYRAAAAGCEVCYGRGYRRELAVFEAFAPTEIFWRKVAAGANAGELLRAAASETGFRPMFEHAIDRVMAGQTSVDEIFGKVPKP